MKINPSRLFPHPVVWFANDDYKNSDFTMDMNHRVDFGKLIIAYSFSTENDDLINRIDSGDMSFSIHVEAPFSMFRKTFIVSDIEGEIEIETRFLADKVDILPLIIANKDLDNYHNKDLNEDYHGAILRIPKGAIMGISDYRYLYIENEKNDLGKKESIFTFVKNQSDDIMKIETEEQKLIIKLKENDFNKLQMLQSTSHYQHVVYSMFIIPALIFALESIEEDVEIMRERLWFRSLEKAFKANNIELNKTTVEQRTSYVMAQLLLEDPIGRALTSLTEIRGEN